MPTLRPKSGGRCGLEEAFDRLALFLKKNSKELDNVL